MEEKCYYCGQENGNSLHKIHPDCEKIWNLSAYTKEELERNLSKLGIEKFA